MAGIVLTRSLKRPPAFSHQQTRVIPGSKVLSIHKMTGSWKKAAMRGIASAGF
jgi:hypothetical protein